MKIKMPAKVGKGFYFVDGWGHPTNCCEEALEPCCTVGILAFAIAEDAKIDLKDALRTAESLLNDLDVPEGNDSLEDEERYNYAYKILSEFGEME